MIKRAIIIGDTQVKPGENLEFLDHIGDYIADKQPELIVHIGDHWDFPSLSSYDRGKLSFEGRRVKADIEAGHEGMRRILAPLRDLQFQQRKNKKRIYNPRMIFTAGNHEDRFDRLVRDQPELDGWAGVSTLDIEGYGFEFYPYLQPVCVEGVNFVHYVANPMTGKPYGGTALNILKNAGNSFVMGHKQVLDIAVRPNLSGQMQIAIVNGACYPHDEDYKGPQGNTHFRGLTVLHNMQDGYGDPMFVSLDFLENRYVEKYGQ